MSADRLSGYWARILGKAWSTPCPKCHAPVGAPCADHRSHDRDLFGARTHRERRQALRVAHREDT